MKIKLLTLVFFCFQADAFFSQSLNIEWQKCLGGTFQSDSIIVNDTLHLQPAFSGTDVLEKIRKTTDNGYIVVGTTGSDNYDVIGNHGLNDIWVVKLNNSGAIEWQKCYGGSFNDYGNDIQQTSDGGYIVCGSTNSNDGDVVGFHGNPNYYDYNDFFILKITSTGSIEWKKCLGGNRDEQAFSVTKSIDGGFIISGYTNTNNNGDVSGYNANNNWYDKDAWVVKLNSSGNFVWKKCFGDSEDDRFTNVKELNDGSLLFAGITTSYQFTGNHGGVDFWLVKTDANGVIQWQKLYGGSSSDIFKSLEITSDQGFILTGETFSHNGDVLNTLNVTSSASDIWVLRLDASGSIIWQKCYGGTLNESGNDIIQTSDGGFALTGNTASFNGNVSYNYGSQDFWLLKINSTGSLMWQKSLGGTNDDVSNSLVATADGGYVLAGYINSDDYNSTISGSHDFADGWVVKLGPYNSLTESESFDFSVSPNPTKDLITLKLDKILNKQIKILDQFGRIMLETKIESTETQIDLGQFASGIYFLQMEGIFQPARIVKE